MGCIGGWKSVPRTIGQWPRSLGNGTLLVSGASPFANDGIGGWTGTKQVCRFKITYKFKNFRGENCEKQHENLYIIQRLVQYKAHLI